MAISRNERRKLAKQRKVAKAIRVIDGQAYAKLQEVREKVSKNMQSPIERNYYPQSQIAELKGSTHTGYSETNPNPAYARWKALQNWVSSPVK